MSNSVILLINKKTLKLKRRKCGCWTLRRVSNRGDDDVSPNSQQTHIPSRSGL